MGIYLEGHFLIAWFKLTLIIIHIKILFIILKLFYNAICTYFSL